MKIAIRQVTRSGNNVHGYFYFNEHRVGELHCTPSEYQIFTDMLHSGNLSLGGVSEDLEFDRI